MPSWITLTTQNRADLIAFIKTFSPRWQTEKSGDPINVPPEPTLTLQSIKHGQELFQKLECWKCHGQEGRGDGPSASTLTDSNDQPIRPYNFAAGSRFKCGVTNSDLYKIFLTGVDGTPMPSFGDVVKPEEAWDLVHYLRTLQVNKKSPELALWMSTKEGAAIVAHKELPVPLPVLVSSSSFVVARGFKENRNASQTDYHCSVFINRRSGHVVRRTL